MAQHTKKYIVELIKKLGPNTVFDIDFTRRRLQSELGIKRTHQQVTMALNGMTYGYDAELERIERGRYRPLKRTKQVVANARVEPVLAQEILAITPDEEEYDYDDNEDVAIRIGNTKEGAPIFKFHDVVYRGIEI